MRTHSHPARDVHRGGCLLLRTVSISATTSPATTLSPSFLRHLARLPCTGWARTGKVVHGARGVCKSVAQTLRGQLKVEGSTTVLACRTHLRHGGRQRRHGHHRVGRHCVKAACQPAGAAEGRVPGAGDKQPWRLSAGQRQGRTVVCCGGVGPPLRGGGGRHATGGVGGARREAVGSRPGEVASRTRPSATA